MQALKIVLAIISLGSAAAFAPQAQPRFMTKLNADRLVGADGNPLDPMKIKPVNTEHVGKGGMVDTRDPETMTHEDPRKSISAAPSFEEYMKQRANQ
eukprot:CAMPEP_0205905424 /NCGR_PEP_ID=MMETSP1325-20131115/1334_1 /ASSEMBLY_ACC=CAM_ASM_000708 /TAXON_ID=236786 /ORGANISM="Florenciella sp., Strain RCC1007" /LENGTH=96 /DNA_ID=CAMNT_0053271333 /DNA_START=37 /DNA_END=327 /DNA_ORIENTATION=-